MDRVFDLFGVEQEHHTAVSTVLRPGDHMLEHIELTDDESLLSGGCRALTTTGEIDATIDTQFTRIVETLLPDSKRRESGSTQDSEA